MKKKTLALIVASLLILVGIIGTMAWLKTESNPVLNTFTKGDINIDLTEKAGKEENYEFKMIPGWEITKDPVATVKANSEDCFLFVEIEKSLNYDKYLAEYAVADGWTKLETGVYYREVKTDETKDQAFGILTDDKVFVKDTVTKANMEELTSKDLYPTLKFTAYAIQMNKSNDTKFTPAEAWEQAKSIAK